MKKIVVAIFSTIILITVGLMIFALIDTGCNADPADDILGNHGDLFLTLLPFAIIILSEVDLFANTLYFCHKDKRIFDTVVNLIASFFSVTAIITVITMYLGTSLVLCEIILLSIIVLYCLLRMFQFVKRFF